MTRKIKDRNYLVHGVGDNDVYFNNDGSRWLSSKCKFYPRWINMLERCYSDFVHKISPHYSECEVCDEWKKFSSFKTWMEKQEWKGKELDKDIIKPGNKIYSPDNCCFTSRKLNNLFRHSENIRGRYPQGVSIHKNKKYISRIRIDGKVKNLGCYITVKEAEIAYINAKAKLILALSESEKDVRIQEGLIKHYNAWIAKIPVDNSV